MNPDNLLYYPQYCQAAIAATIILLIIYFMKRNYSSRRNQFYLGLLVTNLLASGINILTFYTISFPSYYPLWLCYLSNMVYLFLYNWLGLQFMLYVDSVTKIRRLWKPVKIYAAIIVAYELIVIFTTPFTHFIVYYDKDLKYHHGPLMITLYILAFLDMVMANLMVIKRRKKFNAYQVFSITGFVFGVFASVLYQVFHPSQSISNFVAAMVLFFVYSALENQAYNLYGDTICYNREAFERTIHNFYKEAKTYVVATIKIEDFYNNKLSLGRSGMGRLSQRIAERISREFGKEAYCIDLNDFAIVEEGHADTIEIKNRIRKIFLDPFEIEDISSGRINIIAAKPEITFMNIESDNRIDGDEMVQIIKDLEEHSAREVKTVDPIKRLDIIRREKEVLARLDYALHHNGFQVFYQPIYDVARTGFHSAEALIRLNDEFLGYVSPEEFIPIAEKNGRIGDIGDYVFREVCKFMRDNNVVDRGISYIEINLSPEQCKNAVLTDSFLEIMDEYGIDPRNLNLEITETAEMDNRGMDSLNELMGRLHNRGITFSLDDFGSGFAAINYLICLPVEIVKIDKGILWQAMNDKESMIILRSTIRMIKEVGRKIVVEGVETEEMADVLIESGVDYLQGYLYSKPIPSEEFLKLL